MANSRIREHLVSRPHLLRAKSVLLAAATVIAPGVAVAQVEPVNDGGEIIVTAQRRSERLESVPMSVSAVTNETLAATGVNSVRDLSAVVPGFQLAASGVFPQPAIRGISATVASYFENNVAVYVDGLYQTSSQVLNIDLPNMESAQVLKGPQGTLYGRNATGGALLLNTFDPSDSFRGRAELTYARFDDKRASAYVGGPITEGVGFSIAGYIRRSGGYYKLASRTTPGATRDGPPIEQDMIRGKLKFELSPALSVTLLYSHLRIDDTRTNIFSPIENVSRFYATRPAGATRATKLGVYAYDPENIAKSKQDEFGAKVMLDTGIGSLLSTTGYTDTTVRNRFDFDGSYIPASYITLDPVKTYTFQQALDYNIDSIDRVSLLVGASYFDIVNKAEQFNYAGRDLNASGITPETLANGYNVASNSVFRHHKKAWAAYADATWQFSDAWFLTLGGRYSSEELSAFGQAFSASPASVRRATNAKTTFKKFTPRAALRYEISPRTSIYATYSQGFRSGTYNTTLPACVNTTPACFVPAKQETVKAYEAGFKTAARGFRFDVAGFYYDYRNIQISATKEVAGVVLIDLGNAPKAKIYGAEANISYELFNNFKVNAGGTWLHARYGDGFIYSAVGVSGAAPGINVNQDPLNTYGNVDQFQDLSGLQMTRAPNFSGNIGVTFDVPKGEGGLQFASNLKYSSRFVPSNPSVWGIGVGVPLDRQREQRFVQGAYAQVNASITWTEPGGRYYARIWGNNLTDYQYKLHYNGNSSFGTYIPLSDPLTFGLTLGAKI